MRGWDSDVEDPALPVPRRSTGSVDEVDEDERPGERPSPEIAPDTVETIAISTPRHMLAIPSLPKTSKNSVQRLRNGGYRVNWKCVSNLTRLQLLDLRLK